MIEELPFLGMEEGVQLLKDLYMYYVDEGGDLEGETWVNNIFDS